MTYFGYIFASYLMTATILAGLVAWIVLDARGRSAELAELEAQGVRRRGDGAGAPGETGDRP